MTYNERLVNQTVKNDIPLKGGPHSFGALPWFLAHGVLNSVFALWTFGGSVFLLFLDEVGLPKRQIGAMLALFPFCGVLALGFAPVAARWGWKRVFLFGYGARKGVMALLLLLPGVLAAAGPAAGLVFLFGVIIIFALLRSLAETAYYPWTQEFIPNHLRGKFSGLSLVTGTLASGLALGTAGWVIGQGTGLPRFLWLIAAGCVLGLAGVACMRHVPGGAPRSSRAANGVHRANMMRALRDGTFATYLGASGCVTIGTLLFGCFLPLYVKERLGVAAGAVVTLDIAVMAGGALAGLVLGWAVDRVGSRPVLMPAAALAVLVPLGWMLLPRQIPHALSWCAVLYFLNGFAASGVAIASGRLLFNRVVPPEQSTAYTAIYYAWMGVTGGLAPLLAGNLLSASGDWQIRAGPVTVDGHSLLFLGAALLLTAGWWLYGRVPPDDRHTTRSVLNGLLEAAPWSRLFHVGRGA
jgi:MFS family permease